MVDKNILVALVYPTDKVPTDTKAERDKIVKLMEKVTTFYDQASYKKIKIIPYVTAWHKLSGNFNDYIDSTKDDGNANIIKDTLPRLDAEAIDAAQKEITPKVFDDKKFDSMIVVIYLNKFKIRAWGGTTNSNFSYTSSSVQ
jgi:hypothetical protein